MVRRFVALSLVLALVGCGDESASRADAPDATGASTDSARAAQRTAPPPTPFDAATAVFDTIEPPEQTVEIPPPPAPPPRQGPRPTPPAPPPPRGPAGSCDVRQSEGYCFAYTGEGWTPETARAQCASAPEAAFATSACPLDGRIATCTFERPSAPGRELVYTYYAPYDPTLAELACPGTFSRIEGRP